MNSVKFSHSLIPLHFMREFMLIFTIVLKKSQNITLQDLTTQLQFPSTHPHSSYLQVDPFKIIITNAFTNTEIAIQKDISMPQTNPSSQEVFHALKCSIYNMAAARIINDRMEFLRAEAAINEFFNRLIPSYVFQDSCIAAHTTLQSWMESQHFLDFVLAHNISPTSSPAWAPNLSDIIQRLSENNPNNSVFKYFSSQPENPFAWNHFFANLTQLLPKGYFTWEDHPNLRKHPTLTGKGVRVSHIIQTIALEANLPLRTLLDNTTLICNTMQWPSGENTLWAYTLKDLMYTRTILLQSKVQKLNNMRNLVRFGNMQASRKLYIKTVLSYPLFEMPPDPHTCTMDCKSFHFQRIQEADHPCIPCTFLALDSSQRTQTTLQRRAYPYTCKSCYQTLKNLHNIHIELCSSCELIACKSCFNLLDDPADKDFCSTRNHLLGTP